MNIKRGILALTLGAALVACGGGHEDGNNSETTSTSQSTAYKSLFTLLSDSETGIDFENRLHDDVHTRYNVLSYQYFYNGSGVSVGDVNNDGLQDLFFTGNSEPNKLYINKGNLSFEDGTAAAGLGTKNQWSTGSSMVDVNNDGWLDIYVCNAGPSQNPAERENWLYINNGDGTFTEKGAEYGVNDSNRSTQASFFDYDNDGDLDLFVMNHADYFLIQLGLVFKDLQNPEKMALASSNLYRNDGGKYKRVTEESGMLRYGYGLGLVTVDLNNDGLTDVYQANDYSVPDFMYLNNGDGTFTESLKKHTRQTAWFGMGADAADFNNDGLVDIGVVDMAADDHVRGKTLMLSMNSDAFWTYINQLGYQYQYMFNAMQVNNGDGTFSNIPHMAGVAATDWSWTSLFTDLDNDGYKDYIVTNGYRRYALDNDFRNQMKAVREANGGGVPEAFKEEMYAKMPEVPLPNTIYHNNGDLTFEKVSAEWGMGQASFSNGAAVADLDNDGDLDFVVNNIDQKAFVYRNNATEQTSNNWVRFQLEGAGSGNDGLNAKVWIYHDGQLQYQEQMPVRGYESSHDRVLHFGLGASNKIDSVRVQWHSGNSQVVTGLNANEVHTFKEAESATKGGHNFAAKPMFERLNTKSAGINYEHVESEFDDFQTEILLPHRQSAVGPLVAVGDVNADGRDDFFIGGAKGQPGALYVQTGGNRFKLQNGPWNADKAHEDMGGHFFDADGDGDLDLYVVSGSTEFGPDSPLLQDRLYINNGGAFAKATNALPKMLTAGFRVESSDIDGDGDLDLFVGGRNVPGKYPYKPNSYLLQNDGSGKFTDVTDAQAPDLRQVGMVNDILWHDYDSDGDKDLIVAGEWTAIEFFQNDGGTFSRATETLGLQDKTGWWYSLTAADVDGDGDTDLIAGNVGLNTKFHASEKKPLHVYSDDMDNSGSCDIVLSKYYKGDLVPVRGRECSSEQMPFVAEKFPTYNAFAHAKLEEIYTPEKLNSALHFQANEFRSMLLINDGSGKYEFVPLPNRAQISPVNSSIVFDFDADGNQDILIAGNMWGAEVETPRYDAGVGLLLTGNSSAEFSPVAPYQSGFSLPYDVKDLQLLKTGQEGKFLLVAACNNRQPVLYSYDAKRSVTLP